MHFSEHDNHEGDKVTWSLGLDGVRELQGISWVQVASSLSGLDGMNSSDLLLADSIANPNWALVASGGIDGRVVLMVREGRDAPYRLLVDSHQTSADLQQHIRGVVTPLPGRICVRKDLALRAAKYFFGTRKPDPELDWELSDST